MQEQRTAIYRYLSEAGWEVQEYAITEVPANAIAVNMAPPEPALPVRIDISLEDAKNKCLDSGLFAVPFDLLSTEGQALFNKADKVEVPVNDVVEAGKPEKLKAEVLISMIKECQSIEELDALMADESRVTVIAAAEEKAAQLSK